MSTRKSSKARPGVIFNHTQLAALMAACNGPLDLSFMGGNKPKGVRVLDRADPVIGSNDAISISAANASAELPACNASLDNANLLRGALQTWAVGAASNDDLNPEIDWLAPPVDVSAEGGYFSYADHSGGLSGLLSMADLRRAPRGGIQIVDGQPAETAARTDAFAIGYDVDEREVGNKPLMPFLQQKVSVLQEIVQLNRLQRALTIYSAIAAATSHVWDATTDPDLVLLDKVNDTGTASGYRATRAYMSAEAWATRLFSHRAKDTAGGFASAAMSEKQLADMLGLSGVLVSKALAKDNAGSLASVLGAKVLLFRAMSNANTEDTSAVKRFWSKDNGQDVRVHVRQVSEKGWRVALTWEEKFIATGPVTGYPCRLLTVSRS